MHLLRDEVQRMDLCALPCLQHVCAVPVGLVIYVCTNSSSLSENSLLHDGWKKKNFSPRNFRYAFGPQEGQFTFGVRFF